MPMVMVGAVLKRMKVKGKVRIRKGIVGRPYLPRRQAGKQPSPPPSSPPLDSGASSSSSTRQGRYRDASASTTKANCVFTINPKPPPPAKPPPPPTTPPPPTYVESRGLPTGPGSAYFADPGAVDTDDPWHSGNVLAEDCKRLTV
eukprot:5567990-Amphidinium_carterae.2